MGGSGRRVIISFRIYLFCVSQEEEKFSFGITGIQCENLRREIGIYSCNLLISSQETGDFLDRKDISIFL